MKSRKSAGRIAKRIKEKIHHKGFMERNRTSTKHFTRKRKLPFAALVFFLLNLTKGTLQKELSHFMQQFSSKHDNISKSAFSQSREKLKPEAFIELNEVLIEEFYTDNDELRWKGFRLLAIDGSTIDISHSKELLAKFGVCHNTGNVVTPKARISSFYDVLNELIIDANIEHYTMGEYDLALKHLPKCNKNDLLLFDRGFGAIWFMYLLNLKGHDFVIRVQRNFILEIDDFLKSREKSKVISITRCPENSEERLQSLKLRFKPFTVRLIKVFLDNGEIEVLMTSLLDSEKYPDAVFKDLYFRRWGIEVNIDHLKNHIEIENFTGLSEIAIKQDFFANVFINNLQSIIARDAQPAINEAKKHASYNYKVNRNLSLGYMKDRVVKILMSNNPKYMEELKMLFQIEPVPIRTGRKNPRNFHKLRRKFNMNHRRAV